MFSIQIEMLMELFKESRGEDGEVDAYELREILNNGEFGGQY